MTRITPFYRPAFWQNHISTQLFLLAIFWFLSPPATGETGFPSRFDAIQTFARTSANTRPVIAPIGNKTIVENSTLTFEFGVSDIETPDRLTVQGTSSNSHLVANSSSSMSFVYLGSGTWRLIISPEPNRFGTTTITLLVIDPGPGLLTQSSSFVLTVTPSTGPNSPAYLTNTPAVRLVRPTTNEVFLAPANILLEADAVDAGGRVTRVEFYQGQGQTPLGIATNSPFVFVWSGAASTLAGYEFWARAVTTRSTGTLTNDSNHVRINVRNLLFPAPTTLTLREGDPPTSISFPGGNPDHPTSVQIVTVNGSAVGVQDYYPLQTNLVWLTGQYTVPFSLQAMDDSFYEGDETFRVEFRDPSNGLPSYTPLLVTIVDDDPKPVVSIANDVTVIEGTGGTNSVSLRLTLSSPLDRGLGVDFVIRDETTLLGKDYLWANGAIPDGSVIFRPNETNAWATFEVITDSLNEDNETFYIDLTDIDSYADLGGKVRGRVTILDDDLQPSLSIIGGTVREGNFGTNPVSFAMQLSGPSGKTITADFSTEDGTALAGVDYLLSSGKLTFRPGETNKTISVSVIGDTLSEGDERFSINLTNVTNALPGILLARGDIQDDDALPQVSVLGATVTEGNSGLVNANFIVRLTAPSAQGITVSFATAPETATSGLDFIPVSTNLTFAPGQMTNIVVVPVVGDTLKETNETFAVLLSTAVNATIIDGKAIGTIIDDDPDLIVRVESATITEGNSGSFSVVVPVLLSGPSSQDISVDIITTDGTASAGSDYVASTNAVVFRAGETTMPVFVIVKGDTTNEPDETILLKLSNAVGARIAEQPGTVTIVNDDRIPLLSIDDVRVTEGNTGATNAVFTVTLSSLATQPVSVDFAISGGTATSGTDYVATPGTFTFKPGEAVKTITVAINGDLRKESDETFFVNLSNPVGAEINHGQGQGTILDDDPLPSISIDDISIAEGNDVLSKALFTISLSAPSDAAVSVDFATANETATAGSDYFDYNATVTFNPGETRQTMIVVVAGDTLDELNETFVVNLSNAKNATIADTQGRAVIVDDDAEPTISISNASVNEGNSGFTRAIFTVTLSGVSSQKVSVDFATGGGNAVADVDYISNGGTLTFNPGETAKPVTVVVIGDTLNEPDGTFGVNLTNNINATLANNRGIGTIVNDDTAPAITITDASVTEGNTGTRAAAFKVSLSEQSSQTVTVMVNTVDQTALAGVDYQSIPLTTLTFEPGQLTKTITVAINGDTEAEQEETYLILLSKPTNATLLDAEAVGTITDDDVPIGLSISDAAKTEGDTDMVELTFLVGISEKSSKPVTVAYETVDDSAVVDADYVKASGTLTFPAGSIDPQPIVVRIKGDLLNEEDESFFVRLSSPTNAVIFDAEGVGLISNNDPLPELSIVGANVVEGGTAAFVARLSAPSGRKVTVQYATANGSATAVEDFTPNSGTLTFAVGETNKTIPILTVDDLLDEGDETFVVRLAGAMNATISKAEALGTVINNDSTPTLSINDVTVTEGDTGVVTAVFKVSLSASSARQVSVSYTTVPGSATAPDDFVAKAETLVFAPGTRTQEIVIAVNGDRVDEPHEMFFVDLSNPINAVLGTAKRGTANIFDDDVEPTLSITDAALLEGNTGTNQMLFTVRLSSLSSQLVTANFTTEDGGAKAGSDYVLTSGLIKFAPGTLTNVIAVPIIADTLHETNEIFEVRLTEAKFAGLADSVGLGTILNDDIPPTLTISDAVISEGNTGRTNLLFGVRLSIASSQTVTVDFKTSDGTAAGGSDFATASGRLTFPPGTVTQSLSIEVLGDLLFEPNETFFVTLTNAVNAGIVDNQGLGTILNDDAPSNQPPIVQITAPANGAAFTSPTEITITVDARDLDGNIQRVDFFVGSTLLGTATAPPFRWTWSTEAAGAYSITATAVDNQGAATTSAPANILVSRRLIASDVAIVRNFPDPEITLLQDYLLELGVSSQVFEQEGLTFDAIKDHKLIIWDDLGATASGLTENDVEIFRQAYSHEISLFFIGEALAASARNLGATRRSQWIELTHLTPAESMTSNGVVTIETASNHAVINGRFGIIANFNSRLGSSALFQAAPGASVLGRSSAADVLIGFEDENSMNLARTLTQAFQPAGGADVRSVEERKRLFKNGASWLLRKTYQSLTDLSIAMTGPDQPVPAGQPITYMATISHQGEIPGSGVIVTIPLPRGMKFVSASFVEGSVSEADGAILYKLGSMESAQQSLFSFVVNPTLGGKLDVQATVTGNEADPSLFNNSSSVSTLVLGEVSDVPKLTLVRLENQSLQLQLSGSPEKSYQLQVSSDLMNWTTVTNLTASQSPFVLDGPAAMELKERFYRLVAP